jgi:hypothetical protein
VVSKGVAGALGRRRREANWGRGGGGGVPRVGTSMEKDEEAVVPTDDDALMRQRQREQVDGAPQSRERKTAGGWHHGARQRAG